MNKILTYGFLLAVLLIWGCEEIYDPEIEEVENVIVVDARIVIGADQNTIALSQTQSFAQTDAAYPIVYDAEVSLLDNEGNEYALPEISSGNFLVDFELDSGLSYKLKIIYNSNIFESDYQSVPVVPVLDSIYGIIETQLTLLGGETDISAAREERGVMLYADITSENENPYYRFTARKVMEYNYEIEVPQMNGPPLPQVIYAWKSFFPNESFNVAAPPEYSGTNEIYKQPLFFLKDKGPVTGGQTFAGWILILYQYGLWRSAYNYYTDLNSQLESEGRLFDPLYVQARGNIECTSDKDQIILGNFEISTLEERRYYVKYISEEMGFHFLKIDEFYDIPLRGDSLLLPPDFWVAR